MIRYSWVIAFCILPFFVCGQITRNYFPAAITDTVTAEMALALKQKLERDKAGVNEPKAQVNTFLKSLYEKQYEYLAKSINDDLFIVDDELTDYLQYVLDKIYEANPQLPAEAKVYAMRSSVPNAVSFGEGTLGFTLALLSRLENEDQIAFVLCHEIAHYHLNHDATDLAHLARLNYDKDLKRKIDEARKNQYGQYTKMMEIFTGMGFSLTRHSRHHEFEADSLGLVFFSATAYDRHAPVRVMEILDSVDVPQHEPRIDFKKYFDFKDYPFKSAWAQYEKSTTWHASIKEDDSLRTHPDCKKRILAMERQMPFLKSPSSRHEPGTAFHDFRIRSDFELVHSQFHFKQYGKALFRSLLLAEQYPENIYLQAIISESLFHLYQYQRSHELGKVLQLPDPRFADNYDRFLTFIHKLRLTELAFITYNYTVSRPEVCFDDEEFLYAVWLSSTLDISQLDDQKVKEEYMQKFPRGRYTKRMTFPKPK